MDIKNLYEIKSKARLIRDFIEEYRDDGGNRKYLEAAIQLSLEIQNSIGWTEEWPGKGYRDIEEGVCKRFGIK